MGPQHRASTRPYQWRALALKEELQIEAHMRQVVNNSADATMPVYHLMTSTEDTFFTFDRNEQNVTSLIFKRGP